MKPLNPTELKRLNRSWRRLPRPRLAILLDGVQGPFNIGAILRSAAALDVDDIFAIGMDSSWTDAKVQKTAMGTHRFLTLSNYQTYQSALTAIDELGYRLVGLELTMNAQPIWHTNLNGDICIVAGHEDHGVSTAVLTACSEIAYIPQLGKVGSMNVATAISIAAYETRRQSLGDMQDAEALGRGSTHHLEAFT